MILYVLMKMPGLDPAGGHLEKNLIAHVDDTQNFTFTFAPGIGDNDIYPGMILCACMHAV